MIELKGKSETGIWRYSAACCAVVIMGLFSIAACDETDNCEGGNEETGTQFALDESYDETRGGIRLMLSYDEGTRLFSGTARNETNATIGCVRVEVHLSNGTELGPTNRMDLAAGASMPVALSAAGETNFDRWSAHPESGCGSSGENGEGEACHGEDGDGD